MVIQSMKMDIPVKSPGDGVIQLLAVSPGGVVNEGDLLAEIA
jgi:biotin carboxyl carrier protein